MVNLQKVQQISDQIYFSGISFQRQHQNFLTAPVVQSLSLHEQMDLKNWFSTPAVRETQQ